MNDPKSFSSSQVEGEFFALDLDDPMYQSLPPDPEPDLELEKERNSKGLRKILTNPFGAAFASILCNAFLGLGLIFVGAEHYEDYGLAMFVIAPCTLGFMSALLFNLFQTRKLGASILNSIIMIVVMGLLSIFFLMEGAICVLMASPILLLSAVGGTVVGYYLSRSVRNRYNLMVIGLLAPILSMSVEDKIDLQPTPQTTESSVIIDAPPQAVWEVLEQPLDFGLQENALFKAGITYPQSMQLVSEKEEAALHVIHSRGTSDLPVVRFEENKEFIFQIDHTPEPMKELSPVGDFDAPHLHGYFNAYLGGFSLEPLPNGQTRLSGTTFYSYKIYPAHYWEHWTEYLIDQMHLYVLNAVKTKTELNHAS